MSSGNKYHRFITGLEAYGEAEEGVWIDVYSVLIAFDVKHPAIQHACKKLLCAGLRGKGSKLQDLEEAIDAINRAIEDVKLEGSSES